MPASDRVRVEERFPARPAVPLALYTLLALVLAGRGCFRASSTHTALLGLGISLAVLVGTLLVRGVLCYHAKGDRALSFASSLAAVAAAAGCACVLVYAQRSHNDAALRALRETRSTDYAITVASDPSYSKGFWRCDAVLRLPEGARLRCTMSLAGDAASRVLWRGELVRVSGSVEELGDSDYDRSLRMRGFGARVRATRLIECQPPEGIIGSILSMRRVTLERLDPLRSEASALLAGLVFGYRGGLKELGVQDDFSRCGLAHLIAVSGSHLTTVAQLVSLSSSRAKRGQRWKDATVAIALALFVVLSGVSTSAVRAYAMTCASLLSKHVGRRSHSLSAAGLVGMVLCIHDIGAVGDLGLILSLASVVGLGLYLRWATYALEVIAPSPRQIAGWRLSRRTLKRIDAIRSALAASLVCQAVALPIVAPIYGTTAPLAGLAGLAVTPLISLTLFLGLPSAALLSLGAPQLCLIAAELPAFACTKVTSLMAACFPQVSLAAFGSFASAVAIVLCLALLIIWPRVSRRKTFIAAGVIVCIAASFFIRIRFLAPARVLMLDVGQGDAIVIQDGAVSLLVDAGPDETVSESLARAWIPHLDAALITHQHADHFAGLASLAHMGISTVYVADGVAGHLIEEFESALAALGPEVRLVELKAGDTLNVGAFTLTLLWPEAKVDGNENAHSLCFEATYKLSPNAEAWRAYFTGDAEQEELAQVLAAGTLGDIDLLKVGHHGSKVSLTAEQAQQLKPELALASAGEGNRYGHPSEECKQVLEDAGACFLCTKDVGTIDVRPVAHGSRVYTARPPP